MADASRTDVVVVGAGLAGLVTARELGRRGREVVVLEARDRLGGRTWLDAALGRDLELGGGWVHWLQPHVWAELTRYGIGVRAVEPLDVAITYYGGERSEHAARDWYARFFTASRPLEEAARRVFPLPYEPLADLSAVAEIDGLAVPEGLVALGVEPERLPDLRSYWASNVSGPAVDGALSTVLHWIALAGWDATLIDEAAGTYAIDGGTRRLVEAIAADVRGAIGLSTRVERIEHGDDGVVVHAGERALEARAAVVTVPWGALAGIELDPPLAGARADAAATGQASRGVKVWARLRGHLPRFIAIAEDDHPLTHVGSEYDTPDGQIVVGFGSDATRLDVTSVDAVRDALRVWLPDVEVDAVAGHDWAHDELTGQTWMMMRPGQLTTAYPAFREPEGALLFAGGDYADGWAGFMDGAIESGLRAARLLDARLG